MSDQETKDDHQFVTKTSRWSDNVEKVIKDIGEQSKGFKWMNTEAAKSAKFRHNLLTYLVIFIGPISGVLSTIATPDDTSQSDVGRTIHILITIFSFTSGVLGLVIKYAKYDKKSTSHKTVAAKYASLEGNIRRQLSLSREDRVNAGQYLQWVSTSFDDLFASAPLIPDSIYNNCVKEAKVRNIAIPQRYGEMVEVDVEEENKIGELCNVGGIRVNNSESSDDLNKSDHIEVVVQGNDTLKREKKKRRRSEFYTSTPDLNHFSDPAMRYQMARLYNLK